MKIMVVEDERELNRMIQDYLKSLGWISFGASSGLEALEIFRNEALDFILLDIMIPGLDGLDVIRRIRDSSRVPIMVISALSEERDKIIGLELGADDYITKPFSLKEIAARIRSVSRRLGDYNSLNSLIVQDLKLDPVRRRLERDNVELHLTAVQFDILHGFMKYPGRVFTRSEILNFFQDDSWVGYERNIDVHIKNIRKILLDGKENSSQYLETLRGVGYRLIEGNLQ